MQKLISKRLQDGLNTSGGKEAFFGTLAHDNEPKILAEYLSIDR